MPEILYRYSNEYFSLSIKFIEEKNYQVVEKNKTEIGIQEIGIHDYKEESEAYKKALEIMADWMKALIQVNNDNLK